MEILEPRPQELSSPLTQSREEHSPSSKYNFGLKSPKVPLSHMEISTTLNPADEKEYHTFPPPTLVPHSLRSESGVEHTVLPPTRIPFPVI